MSATLKSALHRPVHQQIADHAEILIGMTDSSLQQIGRVQGVIEGLRIALAVQEEIFKGGGHE